MDPLAELEGIVRRLSGFKQEGDVLSETTEIAEGGFSATVTLGTIGLISFTGEVCETSEEAERSAIRMALSEFAAVGRMAAKHVGGKASKRAAEDALLAPGEASGEPHAPADAGKKRQRVDAGAAAPVSAFKFPPGPPAGPAAPPVGRGAPLVRPSPLFQKKALGNSALVEENAKGELNTVVAKMLGRPLTKDDQVYTSQSSPLGFISTLVLPALGPEGYRGAPKRKIKDSEQSAAAAAVAKLSPRAPAVMPARPKSVPKLPSQAVRVPVTTGIASPAASPRPQPQDDPELLAWQEARLEDCYVSTDPQDRLTLDLWYGQVCLCCLCVCAKSTWLSHAAGQKHQKKFESRPVRKRLELPRPPTEPSRELLGAEWFVETAGWAEVDSSGKYIPVLIVGEMDYSFSLSVAKLRDVGSPLVCTSYLEEHDPNEPEVYPSDDGERAAYSRRSLPAMKGDLFRNLDGLKKLKAEVRHGVDAMNLKRTLRSQGITGAFQRVVFPFPRASLQRACDPRNSRLLRNFFLSAIQDGFIMEGGIIQLVMLSTQYEEWDVAGMAAEAGLDLVARVQLPPDFYQSREMSGKPWTPQGAELLNFGAAEGESL